MDTIKKYGGAILTGIATLVLVIVLCAVFWLLTKLVPPTEALPLLAIGGVVVLIFMLTAVAMIFSILGLTNANLAMGLPEGSIRAVIALSLIVLFAILSIFLYQNVSTGSPLVTIANLSDTERAQFMRDHTNARDIQSVVVKDKDGQPLAFKDSAGQPIKNADGTPKYFYDVTYRSTNAAGDDFAKQLLVLLGTLMTAITSFYLGAGTVTSAVKAGSEAAGTPAPTSQPTFGSIKPTAPHSIATDGATLHLEITGTNLDKVTDVRIAKAGTLPIAGTKVASSSGPTRIVYDFDAAKAGAGTWNIEVDESGSKTPKIAGTVTINL